MNILKGVVSLASHTLGVVTSKGISRVHIGNLVTSTTFRSGRNAVHQILFGVWPAKLALKWITIWYQFLALLLISKSLTVYGMLNKNWWLTLISSLISDPVLYFSMCFWVTEDFIKGLSFDLSLNFTDRTPTNANYSLAHSPILLGHALDLYCSHRHMIY